MPIAAVRATSSSFKEILLSQTEGDFLGARFNAVQRHVRVWSNPNFPTVSAKHRGLGPTFMSDSIRASVRASRVRLQPPGN
jgi:hypothetical protein